MTVATTDIDVRDETANLEQLARQHAGTGPPWLRPLREKAIARFAELGLPTKKDEEWRYTDPAPITQTRFDLPTAEGSVTAEQLEQFAITGLNCHRLVFVNGRYLQQHTSLTDLPPGVKVLPLAEALRSHQGMLEHHIAAGGEASNEMFTRLNAALFDDGVFVYVPDNKQLKQPIHVLNITTDEAATGENPPILSPRTIIVAGEHAQASVIEHYVALTENVYFNNAVTQLQAGRGAHLHHYLIEEESPAAFQLSTLMTDQQRDSDVRSHTILFGGKLVRNNCNPQLNGEGGHCLVNGLYMGRDTQHMDNHMRVEHNAAHCDSRQFYKGVLNDKAHAVFSGRIFVKKGAQKTDAKQENSNLLLSSDAEATTKPQLEIFADDVKCTHGATVGQIQDEAVFYLMARGVSREAARAIMIYAFAAEGLERMEHPELRSFVAHRILERLPQGNWLKTVLGEV